VIELDCPECGLVIVIEDPWAVLGQEEVICLCGAEYDLEYEASWSEEGDSYYFWLNCR